MPMQSIAGDQKEWMVADGNLSGGPFAFWFFILGVRLIASMFGV